jgi:hypothetical protein
LRALVDIATIIIRIIIISVFAGWLCPKNLLGILKPKFMLLDGRIEFTWILITLTIYMMQRKMVYKVNCKLMTEQIDKINIRINFNGVARWYLDFLRQFNHS